MTGHRGPSVVKRQERGEHPNRSGLACAVGPENPDDGPLVNCQVNTCDRFDGLLSGAEGLGQTLGDDRIQRPCPFMNTAFAVWFPERRLDALS